MGKKVLVLLSVFLSASYAASQAKSDTVPSAQAQRAAAERETGVASGDFASAAERVRQNTMAQVISQRHSQLQQDTEKLVELAAELKQHVDKTNANILSMDVIKKAEEIQKLAKSVQDKMKNAY